MGRAPDRLRELRDPVLAPCEHCWHLSFGAGGYTCDCGAWKPADHRRPWRHFFATLLRELSYRFDGVE